MLLRAPCAAAGGPGSGLALLQVKEQPALQMITPISKQSAL